MDDEIKGAVDSIRGMGSTSELQERMQQSKMSPEEMESTKQRILEADKIKDLQAIVSTCPFCKSNLKQAVERMGRSYKVMDLTELLQECL